MAAKRSCPAPTDALALDHVRFCVVQCLESHHDIVSFLRALPASSLDGPLAALLKLLTSADFFWWPTICLENLSASGRNLALAALRLIPDVRIHDYKKLEDALAGHFPDLGAFSAAWPTKVKVMTDMIYCADVKKVRRFVEHCTHLESICVHANAFADLLPSLPSTIAYVEFFDGDADDPERQQDDDVNLAPSLRQWLATGAPEKDIRIECRLTRDDAAAVAHLLATTSSVVALDIEWCHELVTALSTKPLPHLTRFAINGDLRLVSHLDAAKLTQLSVKVFVSFAWVLQLLPTMPNLEELALIDGNLDAFPLDFANVTPRLQKLSLINPKKVSNSALGAFYTWTSGLQQLRSIHCSGLDLEDLRLQSALQRWIRNGIVNIELTFCQAGNDGARLIAAALRDLPRASALAYVNLEFNEIDRNAVWALIVAMAHRVDTTVLVNTLMDDTTFRGVQRMAQSRYGVRVSRSSSDHYALQSPLL